MAGPLCKPIDWSKSHLRIGYLVEGVYRDPTGGRHVVRWCGPKARTGSGITARPTVDGSPIFEAVAAEGLPINLDNRSPMTTARSTFEARLSRCVFDKTLGTLKQNMQALSQITMTVDLGDDDLGTASIDATALRDMAIHGRWMGQPVRFSVVDLDDVDSMESLCVGTWDRDPTSVTDRSFRMTIDAGDALPPTLDWPSYQVPVSGAHWAGAPGPWAGTARAPGTFKINPDQSGRWMGQIYGGRTGDLYTELVPYGAEGTSWFALVSPRFDQFCYDVYYEKDGGGVAQVSGIGGASIIVFNNDDPRLGPYGTCVKFSTSSDFSPTGGARVVGKVAGGPDMISRPATYGPIFPSALTDLGNNGAASSTTRAEPFHYGSDQWSQPHLVFADMVIDLMGAPGALHPDAVAELLQFSVDALPPGSWNRSCAVPNSLTDEPLSFRKAVEQFMKTIPADLIMKRDAASTLFDRKFFAVPRQRPGAVAIKTFTEADLVRTVPKNTITHNADPDGVYGNATTVEADGFLAEPDTTSGTLITSSGRAVQLNDLTEQSDAATGQVINQEIKILNWNWSDDTGFNALAGLLEAERSRPQPVLEALHGYPSYRYDLGDVIKYNIPGVYSGPGQIRSMRLDLDKQSVKVRSYHQPTAPRVAAVEGEVARKDKAAQVAEKQQASRDRTRLGKPRPGTYRAG